MTLERWEAYVRLAQKDEEGRLARDITAVLLKPTKGGVENPMVVSDWAPGTQIRGDRGRS